MRVPAIEAALKANWSAAALDGVKVSDDGLMADIHGTSDYRANLIKVMAQRAVTPRADRVIPHDGRRRASGAPFAYARRLPHWRHAALRRKAACHRLAPAWTI